MVSTMKAWIPARVDAPTKTAGWLLLGGGLAAEVGLWLPWFDVAAPFTGRSATAGPALTLSGGLMAALALLVIATGALILLGRAGRLTLWIGSVAAAFVLAGAVRAVLAPSNASADALTSEAARRIAGIDPPAELREALRRAVEAGDIVASATYGVWVTLAGAAAALAGGVLALVDRVRTQA
jgi:hypothetical protein